MNHGVELWVKQNTSLELVKGALRRRGEQSTLWLSGRKLRGLRHCGVGQY